MLAAEELRAGPRRPEAKHLLDLAPQFVQATGRHAVLLYKEEIEVLLRTPRYAGFSLLDLHDYPGQGTALIGPLDPFWDSKGFVTPEAHRRYCGPTVPLLRMPKRTYTADEPFEPPPRWPTSARTILPARSRCGRISDEQGREIAAGTLPPSNRADRQADRAGRVRGLAGQGRRAVQADRERAHSRNAIRQRLGYLGLSAGCRRAPPADVVVARDWDDATRPLWPPAEGRDLFPKTLSRHTLASGPFPAGLLESGLVPHAEAEHDGHSLRSQASGAGLVPDRVLQQLAVVRLDGAFAHLDPRRHAGRVPADRPGDRQLRPQS